MNNLQINTQAPADPSHATASNTSGNNNLRLPHYFEKKGYRAIKVIGEGAYGKALLVSTALAKPSFSNGIPNLENRNSSKYASSKRKDDVSSSQDSSSQQVPPLVVIKHVNMSKFSKAERAAAKNEVGMLKMLNHPNIVHYYDSVEVDVDQLYICLEYADGGDLAAKIKRNRDNVTEAELLSLFRQVVDAVGYMHTQKVLHRDLKPQNIFLSKDGTQVKVGDFGFSKALNYTFAMANTLCGTPYYYSPELCKGKPYNSASDVWALGVMLYEMFAQKVPFDAKSIPQLAAAICTKEPARPKELSSDRCDPIWLLLCELLCKNPLGRPDCPFILKHPVLNQKAVTDICGPITTSAEYSVRETRSSTPAMTNQRKSPSDLPPPARAPLALARKDSFSEPQSNNSPVNDRPASTANGEDAYRQRPSQQMLRQQLADHPLRPPSRIQHPNLLPPRHPAMPSAPQRDRKVDGTEPKNTSPVRRPSLQSLKVGGDNNFVGSCNNIPPTDKDRHHQHNIFDTLKGLPAIQHPLRLPTPVKQHTSVDSKVAMA